MGCARTAARLRVLLCGAILIAGCATRPTASPTRSWEAPCDTCIAGVVNFAKISPELWRGAQPTDEGFRNLERAGVKTILSLREHHDDLPLLGETKLKYLRIPMHAWDPEEAKLVLLLNVFERMLKDPDSRPVFVHCEEGRDRTGYSVAAYRITFLRRLDVERVRALMKLAP